MLAREDELRAEFGITRIADLTHMDRMCVPVMCAVVPESIDDVSVYSGRGGSAAQARCGALMETAERLTAASCEVRDYMLRPKDIDDLDWAECGLGSDFFETAMPFVVGRDLIRGAEVLVPKALVQMPWRGVAAFPSTHTNGLAAGISLDSAMLHALYEVVERHLWSVTEARAHLRPKALLQRHIGFADWFIDDPVDEVRFPCGHDEIDDLWQRAKQTGSGLRLIVLRHDDLPPGFSATLTEPHGASLRVHTGMGCSFCAADAAVSAITEAVQARVADTHGTRENILRVTDPPSRFSNHTRRRGAPPRGRWFYDGPSRTVDFATIESKTPNDAQALAALLDILESMGVSIVAVTLSPPNCWYHVVRIIAPQLETGIVDGRRGAFAQALTS